MRPDANPLRRTCDRVESWVLIVLGAGFLVGAPVTAVLSGSSIYRAGIRAERASLQVTAVLLADAGSRGSHGDRVNAPARWTMPGGGARWGRVHAPVGARVGAAERVWVDGSGRLTAAPPTGPGLDREVAIAAFFAVTALGAMLVGAAALTRWVVDRRRLAAWEADWRWTEPRWARYSGQ